MDQNLFNLQQEFFVSEVYIEVRIWKDEENANKGEN